MFASNIKYFIGFFILPIFLVVSVTCAVFARLLAPRSGRPRLVWGSTPVINNRHWSRVLRGLGYPSETFVVNYYSSINKSNDWDRILFDEMNFIPMQLRCILAFILSIFRYDVFFISVDGFFIGRFPVIWRLQAFIFKIAGKKVVVLTYGGDAYVYRNVRSTSLVHGLLCSYPDAGRHQHEIQRRLDYWCRHADVFVGGIMSFDGIGRWDVPLASTLFLDLSEWARSTRVNQFDGTSGPVRVCHAPNHRGFKGSEFVIDAVQTLQAEGLLVDLVLLEGVQNDHVKHVLANEVDILVEQIVFTGHGMNGLEGLASGLPVICNLEDENYILPLRRWSYFSECPLVSASPENITDVLRTLVKTPSLRNEIGTASRKYAEKYHGVESAEYFFQAILDKALGTRESIIDIFHPLLSPHCTRLPQIVHPLKNNRIVD